MYVAHFGLRQRPFRSTPNPGCYYPASTHEDALQQLVQALADDEGFALLTGEPGTGKTLLAAILLDRLGEHSSCAFVTNCHLQRPADLFQAILYDLGLPYEGKSEQELRLGLTDCLLTRLSEGGRTVLLLDEAHHLPADVLEELRLMGNLEARHGRAVQVVLVAQPTLLDTLGQSALQAFAQRLTTRPVLGRLTSEESADYLMHNLRVAGARPDAILDPEAVDLLTRGCGGLPRLLNQAAHLALTLTWQAGSGRVDAEGALEALLRLGLDAGTEADATLGLDAPHPVSTETQPALTVTASQDGDIEADLGWPPGAFQSAPSRLTYTPGRSG